MSALEPGLRRLGVHLPIVLAYAAFVLIGIYVGASGVLLPEQIADYGVDKATIGITFFTSSVGFVIAGAAAGGLIHRFGSRLTLLIGGSAFALGSLYLASRPPFLAFVLVQVLCGFGTGALESVLNAHLAGLPNSTTLLNRLHAFFGVGALLWRPGY
jgi:fucose permease